MAGSFLLPLPDDILLEIFMHRQKMMQDEPGTEPDVDARRHIGMISWIPEVTHVCQRWRNLAIYSPLLWTNIVLASPDCVATFLERCGQAPLHVKGQIREDDTVDYIIGTLGRIITRSEQIVSLELSLPTFLPPAFAALDQPRRHLAQLVRLKLHAPIPYGFPYVRCPPTLLPTFLDSVDYLPHIKELDLFGYPFCQSRRLLSKQLTRLALDEFLDRHEEPHGYSLSDILEVLSDMPMLEDLTIGDGVPLLELDEDGGLRELPTYPYSVALSKLQRLRIDSGGKECATLLHHMILPQVQLLLRVYGPFDPGFGLGLRERNDALLPIIIGSIVRRYLSYSGGLEPREITMLAIDVGWKAPNAPDPNDIRLRIWPSSLPSPSTLGGTHPDESAPLDIRIAEFSKDRILQAIRDDLPLHAVQTVFVGCCSETPEYTPLDDVQISLLRERLPAAAFFSNGSAYTSSEPRRQ